MTDRETDDAFRAQISADPFDDTVRLVYADWLEEHEDPERAEFIRLQIELAVASTGGHKLYRLPWSEKRRRAEDLFATNVPHWDVDPAITYHRTTAEMTLVEVETAHAQSTIQYQRGFGASWDLDTDAGYLEDCETVFNRFPVTAVTSYDLIPNTAYNEWSDDYLYTWDTRDGPIIEAAVPDLVRIARTHWAARCGVRTTDFRTTVAYTTASEAAWALSVALVAVARRRVGLPDVVDRLITLDPNPQF